MESFTAKQIKSGSTTPGSKNAPTLSTDWYLGDRVRDDDEETMVTSVGDDSAPSIIVPGPPLNSPAASYPPSTVSDMDSKVRALTGKLESLSSQGPTPPTSTSGGEKGTARSAQSQGGSRIDQLASKPSANRRFPTSTSIGAMLIRKRAGELAEANKNATAISKSLLKYAKSIESFGDDTVRDPKKGVMEYNQWANYAEEDVAHAFQRLARLARDLHQKDASKTAEEYFSEYLTKLIKAAELEYDPTGLL
ncbi:hypothetical protein Tdes44962_MAKER01799 [Teratosphaeria destructans]|uniref:Uncharacterized protein n=1 Tax=Teratosphaeria destructans TaxID=418781 RepID=A0A9W7W4R4_9PEZI|nr:hypothetical protein Tdes44962_MAKER01799 [Teratosphaeria destructans]